MQKPVEELILDNIKDTVAGISTAAGYSFDVLRVEDVTEPFNTPEHQKAVVAAEDYRVTGRADHTETRDQDFAVCCWWIGEPNADPPINRRLMRMGADILQALCADRQRGSYAVTTENAGAEMFPDAIVQRIVVTYDVDPDNPRLTVQEAEAE